jgi:hypothetical protein
MSDTLADVRFRWEDELLRCIRGWDRRYIVMGPDVDAMGSANCLQKIFPDAKVIGLYDLSRIWQLVKCSKKKFFEMMLDALWVDHDVLWNIRCIGQHQINGEKGPIPGRHPESFNPNVTFDQEYHNSFVPNKEMQEGQRAKCPFATLIFLLHVFDDKWQRNEFIDALVRHADSTGQNMAKYRKNCQKWLSTLFEGTGTQVEALLKESLEIYKDLDLFTTKRIGVCKECAALATDRHKIREALLAEIRLKLRCLELGGEKYFSVASHDGNSAKGKQAELEGYLKRDSVTSPSSVADITDGTEPAAKRSRVEHHCNELLGDWLNALGGFQGLKMPKEFEEQDSRELLRSINALYTEIGTKAFNNTNVQQFDYIEGHNICRSQTGDICISKKTGKTIVCAKNGSEFMPLNDFLVRMNVFSHANINKQTFSYTLAQRFLTDQHDDD